jgi:hypothetical protein
MFKKILQFNWLTFITYLVQVFLFFVLFIYIPSPPSNATDVGVGAAGEAVGEMIILIFLFILFIITSILYVAWIRNTKVKKSFLIVINAITFMFLLSQVISGFPYIIKESKDGYFSIINGYYRNESIVGKDDYKPINLNGYKVKLFLCTKDTNLLYVRDTVKDSRKEKFYLLHGAILQEIKKEKTAHLLNRLNFDEQLIFSEGFEGRPLVVIPENNQISQKFGRTVIDFTNGTFFNTENIPTVTVWDEFDERNKTELKGFKDFISIDKTSKKDKNGTLYFLFWHLSNPGACIDWKGNFNQEVSLCLAIRKKGGKITVREINLNALPSKERATFYIDRSIENFIVSGNFFYIIVDGQLYFSPLKN